MPARLETARAAGLPDRLLERAQNSPKHVEIDDSTQLAWLGDVIPFRPGRMAISAGDVLLVLGLGVLLAAAMQPAPTRAPIGERRGKANRPPDRARQEVVRMARHEASG
jgi:hypothetical protein